MVGVPTSNRCDNCRKRKKKCDEQKPSCSECIRGGWTCPGYKTQWKFVDETSRLAEHYAGRKYVYDVIDLDLEEAYSRHADEDMRPNGVVVVWKNIRFLRRSRHQTDATHAKSEVTRYHEINPLGSALVYCLGSKVKGNLIPLRLVGSFFEFIPARLGRNAALDNAVSCLCAIYCGTPSIPYNSHRGIYQSYVRALSSLRSCLGDTSLWMESETLCASILLQMCEVSFSRTLELTKLRLNLNHLIKLVVNVDRGEWSQLARGTAFILHSRGVHRYTSAFDHAMLESQLSFVLGQSMRFKEHCFLRSPEWQALLLQGPVWPFQASQSPSLSLRSRLCGTIVELPSLIISYSAINENQINQTGWEEQSDLLMHKASKMLDDVKKWLTVEAEPLFLSYASSQQVVQEHINYPDIVSGVLDCVANTALLTIDKVMRSLCHSMLRSNSLAGRSGQQGLGTSQLLNDSEIIARRRQRAITAFEFVQGESRLAAKPLEFGLRQIQFDSSSYLIDISAG